MDCPICMNPLTNGATVRLPCNHLVCRDCTTNWLTQVHGGQATADECPLCRTQFTTTDNLANDLNAYVENTIANYVIVSVPGMGLGVPLTDQDLANAY